MQPRALSNGTFTCGYSQSTPFLADNNQRQQFYLTENTKYLNIYLVQNAKIFNENSQIFKKYFYYQVKNGNIFDKNTKMFKNIMKYSKILSDIKMKNCYREQRNKNLSNFYQNN